MDIGRGSTDLGDGPTYVRGGHGRYIVKNDNGVKDIVGIAYRGSRNDMKTLAKETFSDRQFTYYIMLADLSIV